MMLCSPSRTSGGSCQAEEPLFRGRSDWQREPGQGQTLQVGRVRREWVSAHTPDHKGEDQIHDGQRTQEPSESVRKLRSDHLQ